KPVVLSAGEWKLVEAVSARIIPTDDEPGAVEAGVVNFVDKALPNEDKALVPVYKAGLAGVDAVATKRFGKPFVELTAADQDTVLAAIESGNADGWPKGAIGAADFFVAVLAHTVFGF